MKIMKILFLLLIICLSKSISYAEFEKPQDSGLNGTNYRLDKNAWNILNCTGSWV